MKTLSSWLREDMERSFKNEILILFCLLFFRYEKKFLLLDHGNGEQSLAVYGITRRGFGVCLILEIFTEIEQDVLHFSSFVLNNIQKLRLLRRISCAVIFTNIFPFF